MAGKKGRSGRKPKIEEFKDTCLLTMTTSWLINSWASFTKEERMKVALIIAPKGVTEKRHITGDLNITELMKSVHANS